MKNPSLLWLSAFTAVLIVIVFIQIKPFHICSLVRWFYSGIKGVHRRLRRIKYSPVMNKYILDYKIRRCVKIVLTEFIDAAVALKSNPFVVLVVFISMALSLLIAQNNASFGQEIANTFSAIIVGLIAIFTTVATFIATISRQSYDRRRNTECTFNKELMRHRDTSKKMFVAVILNKTVPPYQEMGIVNGYAAATIFGQGDYIDFKNTMKANAQGKFTREVWPSYATTYHGIAASAINYRPYAVKNLIAQWESLDDGVKQTARVTNDEVTKLKGACYEYENSGNANYYNQRGLLGPSLFRAIAYGLIATLVPAIYKYLNSPTLNSKLRSSLEFLLLTYSFLAFLLCIRYLFRLLVYLRSSLPFNNSTLQANFRDTTANPEDNIITFKQDD